MVAGGVGHGPSARPQGQERLAECPSAPGRRNTCSAASTARTRAILARIHDRAGRADDAQSLPCPARQDRGSGQHALPSASAHAAARLRLCAGQRRSRQPFAASLPWPQEHPAHGSLYRAGARSISRVLAVAFGIDPTKNRVTSICGSKGAEADVPLASGPCPIDENDRPCVKTHTSAKGRKHNSPARHRTWRAQYDLTLRDAIARRYFYVWRDRWSFRTAKTRSRRRHERSNGEGWRLTTCTARCRMPVY